MATIARKAPVGANPATNGINSLDDSIILATNLKNAISSFASNDGFNLLSLLIDRIPQLEKDINEKDNEIKKKDEQIKVLEVKATSDKEGYTANQQKSLEVYSLAYDKWTQKRATLQSQMESKEAILKEKNEAVMKLQTDLENFKTKRHELEAESKEMITRLTKRDQDIAILKNQLQQARESLSGYSEKLTKSQSQVAELEDLKRKNKNESEKLRSDYSVLRDRMKEVTKLSVPLKDVNVDDM
jgi:chromosome segregation ATPase